MILTGVAPPTARVLVDRFAKHSDWYNPCVWWRFKRTHSPTSNDTNIITTVNISYTIRYPLHLPRNDSVSGGGSVNHTITGMYRVGRLRFTFIVTTTLYTGHVRPIKLLLETKFTDPNIKWFISKQGILSYWYVLILNGCILKAGTVLMFLWSWLGWEYIFADKTCYV